ncbi:uncharacterized protein LOC127726722 [Mytilus californianus]|uniref:uncharacterized protein LOC127726722 n=1 Tax=Mytilus californianus TaxID=6549 RepID=UPI002247CFBC|nr:uncharacterized protein LOC127726722 [Mytilus californianus]
MAAWQLLHTVKKTKVFFYGLLNEISKLRSMKHVSSRYFSSKRRSQTDILKSALNNYKDLQLAPLMIKNCKIGVSFSEAHLEHEVYSCKGNDVVLCENFSNVFEEGFNVLHQSIDKVGVGFFDAPTEGNGTEDYMYYYALSALRDFLTEMDYHEKCLKHKEPFGDAFDKQKEAYVAALLTNHLLSRLVYGNRYLISNDYAVQPPKCPCLKPLECASLINYGQTGLGCEDIWYGHPDIVLVPPNFSNIPLWFFEDDVEAQMQEDDDLLTKDLLQQNNKSIDISEIKLNMVFEKCAEQILSQAITFSFCEANTDSSGERERHTLIPSIVLTPHHYLVVMYDYENDILLSSDHQISPLWDETGVKFNLSAVLQIWLVLNHSYFKPKLSTEFQKDFAFKCEIHRILKELQVFDKTKQITYRPSFRQENKRLKAKKPFMLYSDFKKSFKKVMI